MLPKLISCKSKVFSSEALTRGGNTHSTSYGSIEAANIDCGTTASDSAPKTANQGADTCAKAAFLKAAL